MEQNEKIGFHKGALDCLVKERNELSRLLNIVNSLVEMHIRGLRDEGVDINKEAQEAKAAQDQNDNDEIKDIEIQEGFNDIDKAIEENSKIKIDD
ncbi:MAG: hypothetical protein K0B02_01615 [DPANN group archaeon]|nr:hypothetical protein [DPANN group archaeon]